jgi:hypothetical protein
MKLVQELSVWTEQCALHQEKEGNSYWVYEVSGVYPGC